MFVVSGILLYQNTYGGKGALQVTSNTKSTVYINGKEAGQTPLCIGGEKCKVTSMLKVGKYNVKLVPTEKGYKSFEKSVSINKSILTVIDRTFEKDTSSETSVITLEQISNLLSELSITSSPQKANVFLDDTVVGATPLLLKDIQPKEYEVKLSKPGFKEKVIRIRARKGYRLLASVDLGKTPDIIPTPAPTIASPSAAPAVSTVIILPTPVGFLRVRSQPTTASQEIARVKPGESYELLKEENEWFRIKVDQTTNGWISAQYAQKQ